ncbi:MAG: glycosyl hydrolase family 95 catalytic domain-containing protein [Armatimonadota bacterium]
MELPSWCRRHNEIMPADASRFSTDLSAYLFRHNMVWTGEAGPPGFWSYGAPLGNGDFGALVYGGPENLTYVLGKTDLWVRRAERSYFPDCRYADLLRIYREEDREAFEHLYRGDGARPYIYHGSHLTNGGIFRLHLAEPAGLVGFRQELALADATCRHTFCAPCQGFGYMDPPDFTVTSAVSVAYDVLAIHVQRRELPFGSWSWQLGREHHPALPACRVACRDNLGLLEQELLQGDGYAIAVLQADVPVRLTSAGRSVLGESVQDDTREMTLYLAVASRRDSEDPLGLACERVQRAADAGIAAVQETHRRYWSAFWERSQVYCADERAERWWYLSNYLCGSMYRPGKVSPGLQGMWVKENVPAWNADFHGNINIQSNYWGLFGSNRIELFEPYIRLYHEMLPQCQRDAQQFYGVEGARLPHAGDIDGFELADHEALTLATSLSPGGWIVQLAWWGYLYTLDREYLAEAAYPLLRETAKFYWGILQLMHKGEDGLYQIEPTVFMETTFRKFDGWGTNSLYEVPIIRMNLAQALAAAEILGVDAEWTARWRDALAALPDPSATAEGVWEAWPGRGPATGGHGANVPFITPVFPSEQVSAFHGPAALRAQAQASWEDFRQRTPSAWCGGAPVATAARMGDAAWALQGARFPDRHTGETNGMVTDWQNVYLQADHGPGMALALNNMLLLGLDGSLILFPAMPSDVDAGFHSLRAPGAVLVSAEQRAGKVRYAAFQALHGTAMCVLNPFDPLAWDTGTQIAVRVRRADTGEQIVAGDVAFREPLRWQAVPGVVYLLEPVEAPFDSIALLHLDGELANS